MREGLGRRAMVRVQSSIQLDDATMPQPDIAVIRRRSVNDLAPVLPSDVYLLVEVADSSLEFDLGEKLARYAAAGIPEVWVANLRAGELVVNTEPEGAGLRQRPRYPAGWHGKPASVPGRDARVGGFYSCRLTDRGNPRNEMATARTDAIRRFTAAERDAMVAAGIVTDEEREALAAGRRFTVDEYLLLGAAGILAKGGTN